MSINSVILSGRLVADIEIRKTQDMKSVTSFTLAVQRDKDNADFIDCVAWEKTAELLQKYKHKGSYLAITGRLRKRQWQNQQGENRYTTEVVVSNIDLGSRDSDTSQTQDQGYNQPQNQYNATQSTQTNSYRGYGQQNDGLDIDSDDLPF